jgi:hypothetical protein
VKFLDDYSAGIALCCVGSVILVPIIYLGITEDLKGLVPLIAFSIILHIAGLMMITISILIDRWRVEASMYYDWGL